MPPAPSARIAGYEILESLGLPGGRLVYVATEVDSRRRVVLKLAPLGDEEAARRLRRELEVLLVAAGPGVVRTIGHGEAPHLGFAYLALEAHGPSLAAALGASPGHRLPADQAIAAVRAAALALAELHARGWCHGDVKPGNFLFSGDGSAVLTDLECAAPLSPAERERRAGDSFAATHAFVAPEVWTLGAGALSARSDVWALGVTLYFALTGVYPYGYQDPREISEAARSGAAPVFPREVPGPAAKAAIAMLSYDPGKRPADGREAAERLSLALAELEVDGQLALESFLVSLRSLAIFRALTEPPTTKVPRASVGPAPAPAQLAAAAPARAPAPGP
ncbi:MAG: protein kinase, partial [Planctomycetes bacterium]|nr:protein kinase [Planctomycetota bacterium]